jgi:hypothetical protein
VSIRSSARDVASSAGGLTLAVVTRGVASRPAAKPLHPRGVVRAGTLTRFGSEAVSGVAWLDEPGTDAVLVRESRAFGLGGRLPDVLGWALRISLDAGHADLLFASTGLGRITRFTLTPARSPYSRPLTTLLPYRTPVGPVVLSAVVPDPTSVRLAWAVGTGPWNRFGEVEVDSGSGAGDARVSFDPVLNPVPGLVPYEWVRRLREPAYRTARRSRGQ